MMVFLYSIGIVSGMQFLTFQATECLGVSTCIVQIGDAHGAGFLKLSAIV